MFQSIQEFFQFHRIHAPSIVGSRIDLILDFPITGARISVPARDQHVPGGEMWVTETADSGAGGSSWASTYLDVPRTLNELAGFVTVTDGVLFHNTLCSSDYGYLRHSTFKPRPSYFAVKLWQDLVGNTCYDSSIPVEMRKHVYCHSRKDGKDGFVYIVINNSRTESTTVELPQDATKYVLECNGDLRSTIMYLNGRPLVLGENNELPDLNGEAASGIVELAPGACAFFVIYPSPYLFTGTVPPSFLAVQFLEQSIFYN